MTIKSFPIPADFDAKLAELEANGIVISDQTPTSGTLTHGSYEFTYSLDQGKMVVTEVHKPGLVPHALVWGKIEGKLGQPE